MFILKEKKLIETFFEGWEESMIWSYFQDVMGTAYVDDVHNPQSAIVYVNCFAFAAGNPNENLVASFYEEVVSGFSIITARDDKWNDLFAKVGKEKCRRVERYAIKKENDVFDKQKLMQLVNQLDEKYELRMIDQSIFELCKKEMWSADFVSGYKDYEMYEKYGLGFVIFHKNELVAGASSYSSYREGIEVEIDTKEEYRRQGLATVCGAKLILECLEKDLYPSWDAQNKWSVALAEKLGYHFSHTYIAYEMWK